MRLRERLGLAMLLCMAGGLTATPALAQTRYHSYAIRIVPFSPIIALIAGILILIFPRILNYIVAVYLILIGLFGLFAR